jgi:hypothetical protein
LSVPRTFGGQRQPYIRVDYRADIVQDNIFSNICKEEIETFTFKKWQQVDRCSIDTIQMDSTQFVELFCDKKKLVPHHFIADYQSKLV